MENERQVISIDLSKCVRLECPQCGSNRFKPLAMVYTVPRLLSPTGNEHTIPVTVYDCAYCGHSIEAELKGGVS